MGLRVKAVMAFVGLTAGWLFGLEGLSGIAGNIDLAGNILVDIADGIGLVSKGIETIENYLDPSPSKVTEPVAIDGGNSALPTLVETTTPIVEPPKPVICKKGKCEAYDPAKDKVLQQHLIRAERERILAQLQAADPTVSMAEVDLLLKDDDDEDDDNAKYGAKPRKVSKGRKKQSAVRPVEYAVPVDAYGGPEILDPVAPNLSLDRPSSEAEAEVVLEAETETEPSGLRHGTRRLLSSVSGLFRRTSGLLVKVVATVFPWNRRARRRLEENAGDDGDEL